MTEPVVTAPNAAAAIVSAAAKINLCLHIVGTRDDGYHLLDSIVAPISLFDRLIIRSAPASAARVSLRCEPAAAAPPGDENLASRAALQFVRAADIAAAISIDLLKRIPVGAGLGGGSSDAAAVLRALNSLFGTPLSQEQLAALALSLGADVPLFLFGRPARMTGVGETLTPWQGRVHEPIVVAFAGAALGTREVYAKYDDLLTTGRPASSIRAPAPGLAPLHNMLHNDLEAAAFHIHPALHSLKKQLCSLGAEGVAMTGSGGAIFGVWRSWDDARAAAERLRVVGVWASVVRVLTEFPAVELVAK
jgi:4-diphosphocytidyl-2-C-methyl-D-erythritol kinase